MDTTHNEKSVEHRSIARFVLERFNDNAIGFFLDWFVSVPTSYFRAVGRGFVDWEKSWALIVTARYWLKPMWQDFTLPGYIIGFFLRTFRIILATIFYAVYFTIAIVGIVAWFAIPVGMGILIVRNLIFVA